MYVCRIFNQLESMCSYKKEHIELSQLIEATEWEQTKRREGMKTDRYPKC